MDIKSESEPFLEDVYLEHEHVSDPSERALCHHYRKAEQVFTLKAGLVHLCILVLYTLMFSGYYWQQTSKHKLLYDTIRGLDIQVKPTQYMPASLSPFTGDPSPEVDSAWHQFLGNASIRVTAEELSRNGDRQESIALPEGGGHMVWLGVFHQLHCLKRLRRLNYPQIYAANRTQEAKIEDDIHTNHCLELIRQSLMCNPDTSLTTFDWSKSRSKPVLRVGGYHRNCVDWEAFMSGILPRVVSSQEMENLVNPIFE